MSNMYGFENLCSSNDLSHHGVKGQKWGVRRYQNPDGTLTTEGRRRYNKAKEQSTYESSNAKKVGRTAATAAGIAAGATALGLANVASLGLAVPLTTAITGLITSAASGALSGALGSAAVVYGNKFVDKQINKVGSRKVKEFEDEFEELRKTS